MKMKKTHLLFSAMVLFGTCYGQNSAALEKLEGRFGRDQIAEMQAHTHHKYEGLLLFYSSSFMVLENGQERAATDAEIRAVDLDQYNHLRQEKMAVVVHDPQLGKDLRLLSRSEFEALVLSRLSETDRAAYLAYRSAAMELGSKHNR